MKNLFLISNLFLFFVIIGWKLLKPPYVCNNCTNLHTYECFEQHMAAHPEFSVVEMDVVKGRSGKSGPIFLTLFSANYL